MRAHKISRATHYLPFSPSSPSCSARSSSGAKVKRKHTSSSTTLNLFQPLKSFNMWCLQCLQDASAWTQRSSPLWSVGVMRSYITMSTTTAARCTLRLQNFDPLRINTFGFSLAAARLEINKRYSSQWRSCVWGAALGWGHNYIWRREIHRTECAPRARGQIKHTFCTCQIEHTLHTCLVRPYRAPRARGAEQ